MRSSFDRRVVPESVVSLLRACQDRVPCHLGGGAALSGAYLAHRLSQDVDLVCHAPDDVRLVAAHAQAIGADSGVTLRLVRDAGTFLRFEVAGAAGGGLDLDVVYEGVPDLEPPVRLEGVLVESLADLRASKLTCLLSRSEPRDLVDLLMLDRAGFPPENDMAAALRKDGGMDPATLAWLLGQFPTRPLPKVLVDLAPEELRAFRDALANRFRTIARSG